MQTILNHHPFFKNDRVVKLEMPNNTKFWYMADLGEEGRKADPDAGVLSIEGGDLLVIKDKTLLIGCGERTKPLAANMLAKELFRSGVVTDIFKVTLPIQRSSMHLDTICTMVSADEFVVDESYLMSHGSRKLVVDHMRPTPGTSKLRWESLNSLEDALRFLVPEAKFILCGGAERLFQSREQWQDAANFFAIAPGVVMGYDRNERTLKEMEKHGYSITSAAQFAKDWDAKGEKLLQSKTVITLKGHELSRARGGARCMTMPLCRDNVN